MKFLKPFILNETFKSINELDKLSNDLYKLIISELYNKQSYKISIIKPFNKVNIDNYTEIKEFILSDFLKELTTSYNKNTRAYYDHINKKINISLLKKGDLNNIQDLHFTHYNILSSLLHELHHVYDDYRSNGYTTSNKEHKKDVKERERINLSSQLGKDVSDDIHKHLKYHLNLRHEKDARFTEAITKVSFYDKDYEETLTSDIDGNVIVRYFMKDFKDVKKDFINRYDSFNYLNNKNKKDIINKLGKYYIEMIGIVKAKDVQREIENFS